MITKEDAISDIIIVVNGSYDYSITVYLDEVDRPGKNYSPRDTVEVYMDDKDNVMTYWILEDRANIRKGLRELSDGLFKDLVDAMSVFHLDYDSDYIEFSEKKDDEMVEQKSSVAIQEYEIKLKLTKNEFNRLVDCVMCSDVLTDEQMDDLRNMLFDACPFKDEFNWK